MDTKQVIIIRKDLGMRRGKEIAQGSHASGLFLYSRYYHDSDLSYISSEEGQWIRSGFRKVVGTVDSEQQMLSIYDRAKEMGLTVHKVIDEGCTEFNGVHTLTAIAIGPHYEDKINPLTGREGEFPLRLY